MIASLTLVETSSNNSDSSISVGTSGLYAAIALRTILATEVFFFLAKSSIFLICAGENETQKRVAVLFLIFVAYYSLTNPILFSFLATGYHCQFFRKNSKVENCLWSISSSLPILILTFETLQLWGFPGGIFLIWWWGLGYLILAMLLFVIFRSYTFIVVSVICIMSVLVYEYAQIQNPSKKFFHLPYIIECPSNFIVLAFRS